MYLKLFFAAGIGKLSTPDGKALADPEVLRRLTSSVSCALDEAAQALTRMRADQPAASGANALNTAPGTNAGAINPGQEIGQGDRYDHFIQYVDYFRNKLNNDNLVNAQVHFTLSICFVTSVKITNND